MQRRISANSNTGGVGHKVIMIPQEAWDALSTILRVPHPDPSKSHSELVALEERRRIAYLVRLALTSHNTKEL